MRLTPSVGAWQLSDLYRTYAYILSCARALLAIVKCLHCRASFSIGATARTLGSLGCKPELISALTYSPAAADSVALSFTAVVRMAFIESKGTQ